jgi:hypothetical protein
MFWAAIGRNINLSLKYIPVTIARSGELPTGSDEKTIWPSICGTIIIFKSIRKPKTQIVTGSLEEKRILVSAGIAYTKVAHYSVMILTVTKWARCSRQDQHSLLTWRKSTINRSTHVLNQAAPESMAKDSFEKGIWWSIW